jgi:hypothetical protein
MATHEENRVKFVSAFDEALHCWLWNAELGCDLSLWKNSQRHRQRLIIEPIWVRCFSDKVYCDLFVWTLSFVNYPRHSLTPDSFPKFFYSSLVIHRYPTGEDRISQAKSSQAKTGQDRTGQDKTRRDKTRQDKTRQNKTKQDKTKQDKTGQNRTGPGRTRTDRIRFDSLAKQLIAMQCVRVQRTVIERVAWGSLWNGRIEKFWLERREKRTEPVD